MTRVETLRAELETAKNAEIEREKLCYEIAERNRLSVQNIFTENGVTFPLDLKKEWSSDKNAQNWTFNFKSSNSSWEEIRFYLVRYENDSVSLKSCNISSNSCKDLDNVITWGKQLSLIAEVVKDQAKKIADILDNFEKNPEYPQRTTSHIQQDLDEAIEDERVTNIGLRVGKQVMVYVDGHKIRSYSNWELATITKINTKSIQYVWHRVRENGQQWTSEVYVIPNEMRYFRSIDQHNEIVAAENKRKAELKAARGY